MWLRQKPPTMQLICVLLPGLQLLLLILLLPSFVQCGDKLALLSATLRTYQRAGCDTDQVTLTCPQGTSISIELAQYGKSDGGNDGITIEELCSSGRSTVERGGIGGRIPATDGRRKFHRTYSNIQSTTFNTNNINNTIPTSTTTASRGTIPSNGSSSNILSSSYSTVATNTPDNCLWPNALQYSLLQTVVEACQKKKHCKFNATPGAYAQGGSGSSANRGRGSSSSNLNSFRNPGDISTDSSADGTDSASINARTDPCPRVRKFVEIAYKCRPYEFRSKVACENDVIQLECNPYSRIAVYSASFGRTEYESIQCPQPQGVKEETCLASYATETVMQICHGRRRCNLSADSTTFGSPCTIKTRMYLKVVYTCVPKQVLRDRYESTPENDEVTYFDADTINDLNYEDQSYKESEAIPKLQSNLSQKNLAENATATTEGDFSVSLSTTSNPLMTHAKKSGVNLEDDQERLYFYLLIAGSIGVILCIIIVVVRFIIKRRRSHHDNKSQSTTQCDGQTTIPNGFNDSISEIDADIDLTGPVPVSSVSKNQNYITYGPTASLYGSLGPSNVSHTSTTMLLPTNPLMCARQSQSPDIIGFSNTFIGQPPHITSTAIGTVVPISSLAQYTTAPTSFQTSAAGYIMDHDGVLRRPLIGHPQNQLHQQQLQQQQQTIYQPLSQSEVFHYDGTAPRTLSTGLSHNSQFYYG